MSEASILKWQRVMQMFRFAVCDDEPFMLSEVQGLLTAYMEQHRVSVQTDGFTSGRALLDSDKTFDLVLMDIQMEPPDGLETARELRKRGFRGLLIFLTVLKESVFDSFETQPFDYLLKPVEKEKFYCSLDRAVKILGRSVSQDLVVRKNGSCQVVPFSEILYCEVLGRKIFLHSKCGAVLDYYGRMENLEQQVDSRFFRCHRSYLVNLGHVRGYKGGLASMTDGSTVPVSRNKEKALVHALLSHMKERWD